MATLEKMIAFINTTDFERAKDFYAGVLDFRVIGEDDFALSLDANGTRLRISKARDFKPSQGTVLGWEVDDIYAAIRELTSRGVRFEQFNLAFMKQDEHGVWTPPSGDQVAWFKDPDGNTLSLSHHER